MSKLLKGNNPLEVVSGNSIVSAFSVRAFGNMSLSYGDTKGVLDNRKRFLGALGVDYKDLICAKQVHGNSVKYVNETDRGSGAINYEDSIVGTDGFITDIKGLPLAIFTADCLSIFFYDPQRPAIGLIHAGWRSAKENITSVAIRLMQDRFNTRLNELFVGFGPGINSCCYEVSGEFKEYFPKNITEMSEHLYLDLVAVNKMQLIDSGVKDGNIFDSSRCTFCNNNDFFSYRKEGQTAGRLMSIMMLK